MDVMHDSLIIQCVVSNNQSFQRYQIDSPSIDNLIIDNPRIVNPSIDNLVIDNPSIDSQSIDSRSWHALHTSMIDRTEWLDWKNFTDTIIRIWLLLCVGLCYVLV